MHTFRHSEPPDFASKIKNQMTLMGFGCWVLGAGEFGSRKWEVGSGILGLIAEY